MRKPWKIQQIAMARGYVYVLCCCLEFCCYKTCSPDVLKGKQTDPFNVFRASHLEQLVPMLACHRKVYFEGCQVCYKFLIYAFRFSNDLQTSLLQPLMISQDSGILPRQGKDVQSLNDPCPAIPHFKLAILSFMMQRSEICGEHMQQKTEIHLPYFRKLQVYKAFLKEYKGLYNEDPFTILYVSWVWEMFCPSIKVQRAGWCSRCALCEEMSAILRQALDSQRCTTDLCDRKIAHIAMVLCKRLQYQMKQYMARLYGSKQCSITVVGADKATPGIPHFVRTTKDTRGRSLKRRLVEVLKHLNRNKLHF